MITDWRVKLGAKTEDHAHKKKKVTRTKLIGFAKYRDLFLTPFVNRVHSQSSQNFGTLGEHEGIKKINLDFPD